MIKGDDTVAIRTRKVEKVADSRPDISKTFTIIDGTRRMGNIMTMCPPERTLVVDDIDVCEAAMKVENKVDDVVKMAKGMAKMKCRKVTEVGSPGHELARGVRSLRMKTVTFAEYEG